MVLAKIKVESVVLIPLKVFLDRSISVLEAVSEYFMDEKGMSYHEIAVLLNRDDRTIWTCYNRAKKKRKSRGGVKRVVVGDEGEKVPSSVFLDRDVSVLEAIVEYLKEEKELSYHEMAVLLGRNDRTVWTCYNRAKKKRDAHKKGGKKK